MPHLSSLNYLSAFLAGLLVSFTPCVYPIIPIVVSYIGARSAKSTVRAFSLSLSYCLGVAVTYSSLGVFAALTGKIFGLISANPIANLIVGIVFIFFGLSILEVFNLPALNLLGNRPVSAQPTGFGAFVLGVTSAFVMSPCTTPVLGSILVYISSRQNILFGASLMFAFSLGMSVLFLLAGTFSSLINKLPKSAARLNVIKKILGFILIAMGCYFIFLAGRRWM